MLTHLFIHYFQVPIIVPILFVVFAVFLVAMSFIKDPVACGIGLAIALVGVPVYIVFVVWFWREKPTWFSKTMGKKFKFI